MSSDSLMAALARIVDNFVGRRLDYLALYPCVVRQQRADGTLDLDPEDTRIPSCQGIPLRLGLPGVTVTVPAGGRVLLGYEHGDPRRPYASLWESGEVTVISINGGTTRVARVGDSVASHTHEVTVGATVYTTTAAAPAIQGGSSVLKVP